MDQKEIKRGKSLKKKELLEEWMMLNELHIGHRNRVLELEEHIDKLVSIIKKYEYAIETILRLVRLSGVSINTRFAVDGVILLMFPDDQSKEDRENLYKKEGVFRWV